MSLRATLWTILVVVVLAVTCLFTVDVTEVAVVTQFGHPISVITEPGLRWKVPFVHRVRKFDARLQTLEPQQAEFLTKDKKNIVVNYFAVYRVDDPLVYFRALPSEAAARSQLTDVASSQLGAQLAAIQFDEIVNTDADHRRLPDTIAKVRETLRTTAAEKYGIEVVDFDVKRLSFPDQNRRSVFERMRAERERIARRIRSEGEEEARKIRAQADREESRLLAEADKNGKVLIGEGEAEATRIYGEAISQNPEFYEFTRTLEAYRTFVDDKTTLILPADSELMRLLTQGLGDARHEGTKP